MTTKDTKFFTFFGLFWVILGWLALIATFFGFFSLWSISILLIFSLLLFLYSPLSNNFLVKPTKEFWKIALLALLAIFIFAHYTTPTIFSGRDQGSLANAAINLAQNHHIQISFPAEKEFFHIYGHGTALNFPGFSYTSQGNLVPHFPFGYISWLAVFYALFGLNGFIIANGITFFIFLLSFYFLSRLYLKKTPSLIATLLVLTSFIFSWFFKFTLSENLALALVWFGLLQFMFFFKKENKTHLLVSFLTFSLLIFVRPEALAFGFMLLVILRLYYPTWKKFKKNVFSREFCWLTGFFLATFSYSFWINKAFYLTFIKGFLNSFNFSQNTLLANSHLWSSPLYVGRVFSAYALLGYLILGFIGFLYFLKKKKFFWIFPYLVLLPSFIYVFNPSISLDHPWMLRRYLFAVIPASIFYTVLFLDSFFKEKRILFNLLISFLLLTNLIVFLPYLKASPNKQLLPQIEKITTDFTSNDLILVDRKATGNPWASLAEPLHSLYNLQAVYFFNPQDLKKINLSKFTHIYFIIPDNNIEFYRQNGFGPRLLPIKSYRLKVSSLDVIHQAKKASYQKPIRLPEYQDNYIYGQVYLLIPEH